MTSYQPDPVALFRRRLHTQDRISNMPNAPRTVKDVPAQEFVIALAQYFRSTGKVRLASTIHLHGFPWISRGERRLGARDSTAAMRRREAMTRVRTRPVDSPCLYPSVAVVAMRFGSPHRLVRSRSRAPIIAYFLGFAGRTVFSARSWRGCAVVHGSPGTALVDGGRPGRRRECSPGDGRSIRPFIGLARAEHAPSSGRLDAA